jgi:hypothetical protein
VAPRVEREGVVHEIDSELLSRAVARLVEKVPAPDAVEVVLAGDLGASVRSRLGEAGEGQAYSDERYIGSVAGKTLPGPGCNATVVVRAQLLYLGSPENSRAERLFAHEGGHVALHQRHESSSGLPTWCSLGAAEGLFAQLGASSIEDYRIQSALRERNLRCHDLILPSLAEHLAGLFEGFRDAYRKPLLQSYAAVIECFQNLVTKIIYVAAEVPAAPTSVSQALAVVTQGPQWLRLVAPAWKPLLEGLALIPTADVSWAREHSDATAISLGSLLRDWMRVIGFTLEDRQSGPWFGYTRDDWHQK